MIEVDGVLAAFGVALFARMSACKTRETSSFNGTTLIALDATNPLRFAEMCHKPVISSGVFTSQTAYAEHLCNPMYFLSSMFHD